MPEQIRDKYEEPIKEGDHVYTRIRGGRHEGEVDKVVTSKEGVKNPPKVYYLAQLLLNGRVSK